MKLTFFNTMEHMPWGGSEELWYSVVKLALQQGHQVQLCIVNWESYTHKKIQELQAAGASTIWRPRVKSLKDVVVGKLKSKYRLTEHYIKKIKAFAPDAILISQPGTFDYFGYERLIEYIDASKMPYFLISQFNTETGAIPSTSFLQRMKTARPWSKFYFVAERNLQVARRQTAMNIPNAKVTDNSMNIKVIEKSVWPTESKTYLLACVARLECAFKGQDVLLEALNDKAFAQVDFKLRFYGSGPDKEHLENLIQFYDLQGKAVIMGHVNNIDEIWDNNHVMVLPSIAEGTPLALREAMLKGRPALSTDVGGGATLVIEGKTGFLIPVCSKEYVKQGLLRLFSTPIERLIEMGDNAYEHTMSIVDLNCISNLLADITNAVNK